MFKKILALLLACLFITSCRANDRVIEGGTDNQVQFITAFGPSLLAESESHFYHIAGSYLYSISKADGEVRVVDSNPDTLDDAETDPARVAESNAFFWNPRSLQYINDKLYVHAEAKHNRSFDSDSPGLSYEDCIFEVDPSGRGQKEIYRAQEFIYEVLIHRGYIYLSTSDAWNLDHRIETDTVTEEEISRMSYQISRVPLSSPKQKPEIVYRQQGTQGVVQKMRAYDNILLFVDGARTFEADGFNKQDTVALDLNTFECSYYVDEGASIIGPTTFRDGLIYQQTVATADAMDLNNPQDREMPIYLTDYWGNEIHKLGQYPLGLLFAYGEYFCIDNYLFHKFGIDTTRELQIYNVKENKQYTVSLPSEFEFILGMSDDSIFVHTASTGQEYSEIHRVVLANLASQEPELEAFFTYQPPVDFPGIRSN